MPPRLPAAYYHTIFELDLEPDRLPASFVVLSACNPMDRAMSDTENLEADKALRARLVSRGHDAFRVTGASPDRKHSEPGWGFAADLDEALSLAREFDQRAIWLIRNDHLHLVDCGDPTPELIGRFSDRLLAP